MTFVVARRLVTDYDLQQPWRMPKTIASDATPQLKISGATPTIQLEYPGTGTAYVRLTSANLELSTPLPVSQNQDLIIAKSLPTLKLSGATPMLTLEYPGTNTVSLRLSAAGTKIDLPEWGAYVDILKTGNLVPVFHAKRIPELSSTAAVELDRTFVLAESLPPNVQLLLYLRADVYNNAGATTCVRGYLTGSGATVELCTTSTVYVTLTGSAVVTTLVNDWLVLALSVVAAGTAFVRNAQVLVIPKAV